MAATVTSVWPAVSDPAGGQNVTIYGEGFLPGSAVTFGGTPATNVVFVSDTEITCTTPVVAAGTVDVVVTPPGAATYNLGNVTSFTDPLPAENGEKRTYKLTAYDVNGASVATSEITSPMFDVPVLATGGTQDLIELPDGRFFVSHTFLADGTFEVLEPVGVEYLLVGGGGGGGGRLGAGGGAGGFLTNEGGTPLSVGAGIHTVSVGAGGAGTSGSGANGGDSVFYGITALGGGGGAGGATADAGSNGGSGGGGSRYGGNSQPNNPGGLGTAGQGNDGGTGCHSGGVSGSNEHGGGGGGAGAPGVNGSAFAEGGDGGAGLASTILGPTHHFAGGGGGAVYTSGTRGGNGGLGGGGGGASNTVSPAGAGAAGYTVGGDGQVAGSTSADGQGGSGGDGTGGGGGGGSWDMGLAGGGGSGIAILRYEISFGFIHSPVHDHLADNVTIWTPPTLVAQPVVHTQTADHLTIPPQTSLLRSLDSWHEHRTIKHFYRFDFKYAPIHEASTGNWQLAFSLDRRPLPAGGLTPTEFGTGAIENLAQGFTLQGSEFGHMGHNLIGFGYYYQYLSFTKTSDGTSPILFDFTDIQSDALLVHTNTIHITSTKATPGPKTPLVTHDAAHAQVAQNIDAGHRSPLVDLLSVHEHTAAQVTIRHEITLTAINAAQQAQIAQNLDLTHRSPASAASSTHSHTAEGLQITHTSLLSTHLALHEVDDDLSAIINRSVLVAAGANHTHYSEHFALTHFSPLAIGAAWHYHRAQRLNFLPEGWVFRALLDISEVDRVIVMGSDDRTAEIPASKSRELEVPAENRVLDVPSEVRELVLEPQGRVSSIGG